MHLRCCHDNPQRCELESGKAKTWQRRARPSAQEIMQRYFFEHLSVRLERTQQQNTSSSREGCFSSMMGVGTAYHHGRMRLLDLTVSEETVVAAMARYLSPLTWGDVLTLCSSE